MSDPTPLERSLLDQLAPARWPYGGDIFHALIARGPLDVDAFASALRSTTELNDGMRTGFRRAPDGSWERFVAPDTGLPVEVADVRNAANPQEAGAQRVLKFRFHTFDLSEPPLARALLVRVSDDETWLLRHASHVILDGWSVVLLNKEVSVRYAALLAGHEPELPARRPGADLARDLQRPPSAESVAHWEAHSFSGAVLRTDHPEPEPPVTVAGHKTVMTPPPVAAGLEAACDTLGVSIRAPLCLAWARAIEPLCTSGASGLHVAFANRKDKARRTSLSYLACSVPLMVALDEPDRAEALRRTMSDLRSHQDHIDALPQKPPSQTIVDYHHVPDYAAGFDMPGVTFHPHLTLPEQVHHMYVHYRLELHSVRMMGTLVHLVRYRRDLFDETTVERVLERFATELAAIAEAVG